MKTKNTLGLDLGTNSIGWAVVKESDSQKVISAAGSCKDGEQQHGR